MGRQIASFLIRVSVMPESSHQPSSCKLLRPNADSNFIAYVPLLVTALLKCDVWNLGCSVLCSIIIYRAGISSASKEKHFMFDTEYPYARSYKLVFLKFKKAQIFEQKDCCLASSSSQEQRQPVTSTESWPWLGRTLLWTRCEVQFTLWLSASCCTSIHTPSSRLKSS